MPIATGDGQPARADGRSCAEKQDDTPRAIDGVRRRCSPYDYNNVEAARQLAALLRETGVDDRATLRRRYQRIVAIDPFDAAAHTGARPAGAEQRNDADAAIREFRAALALGPVDKAAAHSDLAEELPARPASAPRRKKQTLAALEIAPSYERAQDLLLKLSRGVGALSAGDARLLPAAAVAWRCCCARPASLQPRVDAQLADRRPTRASPACSGRFVRIKYHRLDRCRRGRLQHLRRAVVHRRAGGRAEPVAPRQDGDRDRGRTIRSC